jgi:hypothetical protein
LRQQQGRGRKYGGNQRQDEKKPPKTGAGRGFWGTHICRADSEQSYQALIGPAQSVALQTGSTTPEFHHNFRLREIQIFESGLVKLQQKSRLDNLKSSRMRSRITIWHPPHRGPGNKLSHNDRLAPLRGLPGSLQAATTNTKEPVTDLAFTPEGFTGRNFALTGSSDKGPPVILIEMK